MLETDFPGLEPLGEGYVYEGWLIVDDAPVTAGRFKIDATGAAVPRDQAIPGDIAAAAAMYVLTIEPAEGDDPAPSATHVVAGPIGEPLTIGHPAAIATDFADAGGGFILATPTSMTMEDESQGIWYLDPAEGPGAALSLPELPAGWAYEGWVAGPDGPLSTGRFTAAAGADSDAAGPAAGPQAGPPFPGQDFVDPALDLVGMVAVISVEPDPDDSPAPFALKPLVVEIGDALAPTLQTFPAVDTDSLPMGTARWR